VTKRGVGSKTEFHYSFVSGI